MRIEFEVIRDEEYFRTLQRGPVSRVMRRIVVRAAFDVPRGPLTEDQVAELQAVVDSRGLGQRPARVA